MVTSHLPGCYSEVTHNTSGGNMAYPGQAIRFAHTFPAWHRRLSDLDNPQPPLLMRPSVIVGILMAVVCLTLMTLGHFFAGAQGESPLELARCADTPCFRGLTPGKTSWADALAAFGGHSEISDDPAYLKITLFASPDGDRLGAIYLQRPLDPSVTAASAAAIYGEPLCVEIFRRPQTTLIMHYSRAHILMRFSGSRFSPNTPIIAIVLGNPYPHLSEDQPTSACDRETSDEDNPQALLREWQGFATIDHYLKAA